ncbi:MAG TPA: type II secretion system protein [Sedimentisphaerales bacterium]|nr:type II secretion system protein [Sedimentisphaerales bacterium]
MKRAFTLIELLVVIAILAALMAIGLPVMKQAKERANEAACTSNLRQMGMILKAYTSDHDGLFPDPTYIYHSRKSLDPNSPVLYPMGCRWHDARMGLVLRYA